jgi:predicted metal-dependent TIM-barrel fold hydrolase
MAARKKIGKSYRCALVIHVSAKDDKKAAERFLDVIAEGWVKPSDILVKTD